MDGYDGAGYGVGGEGFSFSDPQWVKLRANLGYTRAYAQQVNLAAMTPRGDLCSTGYCLANPAAPGAEFIVFQPSGANSFTVKLNGLSGSFAVEWLNPETGGKSAGAAVNGGGTVTFAPPYANAVLYLKQAGTATPTGTPVKTPTATQVPPAPTPTGTPTAPPQAQFPTSPLLDNFNRPDGHIGVNWGNQPSDFRIANRHLDLPGSGVSIWRPGVFGPNQQAYVTLTAIDPNGGANHAVGVVLKAALAGEQLASGLNVVYAPSARELRVGVYSPSNGWQAVGAPLKAAFSAGDVLGAFAHEDGAVELFRNGVLVGAVAAGTALGAAGGQIGLAVSDPGAQAANAVVDSFGGGNPGGGAPPPFSPQVITSVAGQGTVAVKPAGTLACGQMVTVTAIPQPGWSFVGWTGDLLKSDNPLVYNLFGSLTLTANFASTPPEFALAAVSEGGGAVTVNPPGPYRAGQVLELTALAQPGWRFAGWEGSLQGSDNPLPLQIRTDMDVTASFVRAKSLYFPSIQYGRTGQVPGLDGSCQ